MHHESIYRVTDHGIELQHALRQMLLTPHYTHWVTLNTHAPLSPAHATRHLRLWTRDVLSRLFRSHRFHALALEELLRFVALPELTRTQHPHFHLLLFVHDQRAAWFEGCAAPMWKRIVPFGTVNVQPITQTPADHARIANYATKYADRPFSNENFITSNMLDLAWPPPCSSSAAPDAPTRLGKA